ncbi:metal-dependent hydrolase [Nocardia seriolae]|uniref:Metal-dependent hydrolase n=1 Tax=Nocardia seriolae TaxID=37332 RepID=A0A0B8NM00_9NOCA|nr:metal-dependent hydrolase [Nocardia seriolae]MTJ61373.1 metal-dependent hydrolase [Nocardia seriolae]MTJ74249.1 metal-dependent hydrolase [Nocardia seriolae]MTJ91190.1 metal-dependent hydrolase [Nocardia seriolae]MTK35155.1 metal-dependent hydrolase [Nocardia seriolae]MTK39348.1 metal-dependent hydrolase [Nocardia seriolae]
MVNTLPAQTYPKARRINFRFDPRVSDGRYFVANDMVYSHFVAGMSGGFPAGEESFIRSVRRVADRVTDPVLKKRVTGFVGQEAMHGHEHRKLNEKLVELGYSIAWLDSEKAKERMLWIEERVPPEVHLAMTAAAEHYTAVLAQRVLASDEIQAIPGDPEVWNLLNWHALEELEHKSVAFDVFRAVGGSERTRIGVMLAMYALTLPLTYVGLAVAVGRDENARRQPVRVARETYRLFTGPVFRGLMPELAKYLRPGFHPDDIDTSRLLSRWQQELFGKDGQLVDHLK